jgi:hypothetical protein
MRPPHQRDPQGLHREDSGVVPSQRDGDEGASPKNPDEHRLVTARGGLFYLLNLLNLPAAQELLADQPLHGLAAGWIWLYQLGRALGCEPDEPLASFLAAEAGLTDRFALEDLAPAPDLPMLLRLGTARYGEAVFNGELCDLPALVATTLSHLDLHFRMEDVRVRVRRVALDVNPGWLPWLGRVVTFHYRGAPELAAWGRP